MDLKGILGMTHRIGGGGDVIQADELEGLLEGELVAEGEGLLSVGGAGEERVGLGLALSLLLLLELFFDLYFFLQEMFLLYFLPRFLLFLPLFTLDSFEPLFLRDQLVVT